jgi:hypothetical protein
LVKDRGLAQHVDFVDEYPTQAQIVDYLLASDIYVTPYLDPKQITSGTVVYALRTARPSSRRPTRTPSRCWQVSADSWCRFAVRHSLGRPRSVSWGSRSQATAREQRLRVRAGDCVAARRRAYAGGVDYALLAYGTPARTGASADGLLAPVLPPLR